MFSSPLHLAARRLSAAVYADVGASTALQAASPHRLEALLCEGLASQIAGARGALSRHDVPARGRAIAHVVRIVDEGLCAPLYLALSECARLAETLREGWDGIADQVQAAARPAAEASA